MVLDAPTSTSLMSAGTLSPKETWTVSPRTRSRASSSCNTPSRILGGGIGGRNLIRYWEGILWKKILEGALGLETEDVFSPVAFGWDELAQCMQ